MSDSTTSPPPSGGGDQTDGATPERSPAPSSPASAQPAA